MAGIIYELVTVLEDQKECYEGLVTLAHYKTEAVMNKNMALLTQVVEREEAFIGRVQQLDEKRENLLQDIALVTGLPSEGMTITMIVGKMGESLEVSQKLSALRDELVILLEDLKKQNEVNKQVIGQSLEFVEFTINAIKTTQLTDVGINYGKEGDVPIERPRSFFDHKQ